MQTTLVDGKVYFDRELDRLRREALAALEESLLESSEASESPDADEGEAP